MEAQGAAIIFGPLQTAYERELRTYLKQKYGSENVAILRGRGVIPDSVKIEEGSFLGRRFQVFKDLELQNTYWVFYIEKCAIIFARSRGKLYVLTVGIFVEQETTIIFGGINPARYKTTMYYVLIIYTYV
ncbi:uncharacterized protein LOC116167995 isoform X3 [Photinus pyralis]|uniref:uncharacterized protein LOC116167995 isoform X3 n=1 Tax=Photinus pyralis TaxID=7054 RepID=UPI001266E9B5|nr:uncharacterized protein LOC116167995 isoform X3 [Photinus pyralis]